MTKHRNTILLLALALLLALFISAPVALAQDATDEAPVATLEATSAPAPVNVNINTAPAADAPAPDDSVAIPWDVIKVLIAGLAAAYALPKLIDSVRQDPAAMAQIEAKANALPEPVLQILQKASEMAESAAKLVHAAVDRVPESSKPAQEFDLKLVPDAALVAVLRSRGYAVNPGTVSATGLSMSPRGNPGAPGDSEDR